MNDSFVYDGVSIHVLAESPAEARSGLQVICLFESASAKPIAGSLSVIDRALDGILTQLLHSGAFKGRLAETLLLTPPPGRIGASQLLLVGIGAAASFTAALETEISALVATQAMNLGVAHPFYAPSVLDGGVESPTGNIPGNFIHGVLQSVRTARLLRSRGLYARSTLSDIILLTGKAHFSDTAQATPAAVQDLKD